MLYERLPYQPALGSQLLRPRQDHRPPSTEPSFRRGKPRPSTLRGRRHCRGPKQKSPFPGKRRNHAELGEKGSASGSATTGGGDACADGADGRDFGDRTPAPVGTELLHKNGLSMSMTLTFDLIRVLSFSTWDANLCPFLSYTRAHLVPFTALLNSTPHRGARMLPIVTFLRWPSRAFHLLERYLVYLKEKKKDHRQLTLYHFDATVAVWRRLAIITLRFISIGHRPGSHWTHP